MRGLFPYIYSTCVPSLLLVKDKGTYEKGKVETEIRNRFSEGM